MKVLTIPLLLCLCALLIISSGLANANDIIEFDGSRWVIAFHSQGTTGPQYVTNLTTGIQYYWDGYKWAKSIDGLYPGGEWTLVL